MAGFEVSTEEFQLEVAFQCLNEKCGHLFLARYSSRGHYAPSSFDLQGTLPSVPLKPPIDEEVTAVSASYKKIYTEAAIAEGYGLLEVAGIGYRKALEFLVKDYCAAQTADPEVRDEIDRLPLMACIKKFVKNEDIKDCAERATWLGNDETHYVRLWAEHDIQDLKALIELTTRWITTAVRTDALRKRMPEGRKH